MMTEQEAKTKWCPFSRSMFYGDGPANRPSVRMESIKITDESPCRCLASGCMAWRWEAAPAPRWVPAPNREAEAEHDSDSAGPRPEFPAKFRPYYDADNLAAGWEETYESCIARRKGFCGLAGKPE